MKSVLIREFDAYDYKSTGRFIGYVNEEGKLADVEFAVTRTGGFDITQFSLSPQQLMNLVQIWKEQDFMKPPKVLFDDGDDSVAVELHYHPPHMVMEIHIRGRHESNTKWRVSVNNKEQLTIDQIIELATNGIKSNS